MLINNYNQKVCVLVGAGASSFCGKDSVSPYLPPLGNELFDKLISYSDYYNQLPEKAKNFFKKNDSFEEGFLKLIENLTPIKSMVDLAKYFLQFNISSIENNHYCKLFEILSSKNIQPFLVSLNYEMLAETAASQNYIVQYILNENQIAPSSDRLHVLKLHGGSNFLPSIKENYNLRVRKMGELNIDSLTVHDRLKSIDILNRNNDYYIPLMSFYTFGKKFMVKVQGNDMHDFFVKKYDSIINWCEKIIIIGVHYNESDSHIWEVIQNSNKKICIINPDYMNYPVKIRKKTILNIKTFEECISKKEKAFCDFLDC
ncbi:hypothetical protein Q4Q35_19610 [Flavivirga aquimarina]|uniref:SIR2-like domain-containing protein n=1 Tax=Flavivirga aquimarina TaxID=2027862 RepID=A0ABT8WFS6_9FLAO|nr:hypothetical protein [Flavivirga aquimarina]MDO5972014.1 hypothetical protein [Flavivirga aquimarina]